MERDLQHILSCSLSCSDGLWEELRGARIFITGGTGFFGCWLLESFCYANDRLGLGATLTALTRSPEAFSAKARHLARHPSIRLLAGDVRSFPFPRERFSHVIHAATDASASLNRDHPLVMLDTIVEGARHTLDFALACGARRFLLTSSGAVYGPQPFDVAHVTETYAGAPDPSDPKWTYGEGKRLAELMCSIYHKQFGLECVIARCFAFVGPYLPLDIHYAIGNFIRDALRGGPVKIGGDGTPYRSYLYAADLAVWLWTILLRGVPCRPYNVGAERDLTIAELGSVVSATLDIAGNVKIARAPVAGAQPERYVPSTARAREELGLRESTDLEEAIRRTAEFHRWNACIGPQIT
jgi:nucleoside-diphosphate-sugar epimerase